MWMNREMYESELLCILTALVYTISRNPLAPTGDSHFRVFADARIQSDCNDISLFFNSGKAGRGVEITIQVQPRLETTAEQH